jgi:hypothetical protein
MSPTVRDGLYADLREQLEHPGRRRPLAVGETNASHALGGGMALDGELRFEGSAWTQLGILYATGRISGTLVRRCRRCLREIRTPVSFEESFEVALDPRADGVDLAPHLLGAVAAVHDPLVLCREDCRGLCPRCGADLNAEPAHRCEVGAERDGQRLGDLLT